SDGRGQHGRPRHHALRRTHAARPVPPSGPGPCASAGHGPPPRPARVPDREPLPRPEVPCELGSLPQPLPAARVSTTPAATPSRRPHPALHRVGHGAQVDVAVVELAPRIADSDHRPAPKRFARETLGAEGGAMLKSGVVVRVKPLGAAKAHSHWSYLIFRFASL